MEKWGLIMIDKELDIQKAETSQLVDELCQTESQIEILQCKRNEILKEIIQRENKKSGDQNNE